MPQVPRANGPVPGPAAAIPSCGGQPQYAAPKDPYVGAPVSLGQQLCMRGGGTGPGLATAYTGNWQAPGAPLGPAGAHRHYGGCEPAASVPTRPPAGSSFVTGAYVAGSAGGGYVGGGPSQMGFQPQQGGAGPYAPPPSAQQPGHGLGPGPPPPGVDYQSLAASNSAMR
jgi:hypothetical protein